MKTESRPKAASRVLAKTTTILTDDTTAYILIQAQGLAVRPLELDFEAEIAHWAEHYANSAFAFGRSAIQNSAIR